ncbi:MAG: UDP-glucose/GDP-mannose dehydrogenase family protein [Actinomycetota bacterium]|nr:UDP-glucose/GDP-mannose dehydrogenase family protein [Actinomycetota bacterium]
MRVCIIGTGYVGLTMGACLADIGHDVVCVDIDGSKITSLCNGVIPVHEPGLSKIVEKNYKRNTLSFSMDVGEGVSESDIVFIAVGTPFNEKSVDLSHVESAAKGIAKGINKYTIIANKSTVPVGSAELVKRIILENMVYPHKFDVVSNPEFLREGSAVKDFLNPDRIIIGTDSQKAAEIMTELYRPLKAPILITDQISAEIIKYACNAFLATKVSFINFIANLCDAVGANVKDVATGMGYDKRISFEFLKAGPGWGGSCLPKDCKTFIKIAEDCGYEFNLLKEVLKVNEDQKRLVVVKIRQLLGDLKDKCIGILGLSFKPNTDDVREAPAIDIINHLQTECALVKAYDPAAMENAGRILKGVEFATNAYEVAKDSDMLVLLTEWDEFRWLDFERIKSLLKKPIIFDTRNCLDSQLLTEFGFVYTGIGVKGISLEKIQRPETSLFMEAQGLEGESLI